jgi:TonB family protein
MLYLLNRRFILFFLLLAAASAVGRCLTPASASAPAQSHGDPNGSSPSSGAQSNASAAPPNLMLPATDAPPGGGLGGERAASGKTSPPKPISTADPQCSYQAVEDRQEGTAVLELVIGTDGKPHDIKIVRPLGHGLDERSIEAVSGWTFKPGTREGRSVQMEVEVEITFHDCANAGASQRDDAVTYLRLAAGYFSGEGLAKDPKKGLEYLLRAANLGLPQAQFAMGEYTVLLGDAPGDNVAAYVWYELARRNGFKTKESDEKLKGLAAKMSPENIAQAQTKAKKWKPAQD